MKVTDELKPGQIPFVEAKGNNIIDINRNFALSPEGQALMNRGDVSLVWVNTGDIDIHNTNIEFGAYVSDPDKGI